MRESTVLTTISPGIAAELAPRTLLWTPAFVRLLVAGSAYGFSFSSFHLMPKYLAVEFGATPSQIGWAAGVFGISSVITSVAVGACIDRVSRRRMFAASAFLLAATSIGFALANSLGPMVYVLRILQGVAFTMQMASFSTLVCELAPAERLGEAVGLAGSSMLIMNAIAPAIDEPLARAAGWSAAFTLAALAALISAALVLETTSKRRVVRSAGGSLLAVVRRSTTKAYASVTFLTAIAFASMFTFLQPAALAAGYRDVGSFFVAYAAAACTVRLFAGWVPDRYGRRRVAVAALVPYVLIVAYVACFGPTSLVAIGAVFGFAHGVLFPALNALAIEHTVTAERGRLMTVFAGTFNLGAWGGAAALGPVAEAAGFSAVFAIGAVSATAAFVVLARTTGFALPADEPA
ncbi:MAG TPA: MFS transporter [Candidatus Limnocylindrales bacterium]|nr:MFS transporter [Candidatus Limnocylindrales bacterium]